MRDTQDKQVVQMIISTERACPRCHSVLVKNENEDCYECLNCGYIHCAEIKVSHYNQESGINTNKAM
jgi:ribosomal protein S27AE